MGYYNTFKINRDQFVDVMYERDKWYQIDILLDWLNFNIAFFIDGDFMVRTPFHSRERDKILESEQASCDIEDLIN